MLAEHIKKVLLKTTSWWKCLDIKVRKKQSDDFKNIQLQMLNYLSFIP